MSSKLTAAVLTSLIASSAVGAANAGSLENLERERAIALRTILDTTVQPQEKLDRLNVSKRRLIDLERIVIRDKSLAKKNTPVVRTAFENYDLTFLVHASTEKQKTITDHWLEQVGVSTNALLSARIGRR